MPVTVTYCLHRIREGIYANCIFYMNFTELSFIINRTIAHEKVIHPHRVPLLTDRR